MNHYYQHTHVTHGGVTPARHRAGERSIGAACGQWDGCDCFGHLHWVEELNQHDVIIQSHSYTWRNIQWTLDVSFYFHWINVWDGQEIMQRQEDSQWGWIVFTHSGCQMMVSVFMSCSVPSNTHTSCSPSMICMAKGLREEIKYTRKWK